MAYVTTLKESTNTSISLLLSGKLRIPGDWLQDGFVENYNRPRHLTCWMEHGRLYEANEAEDGPHRAYGETNELVINAEGEIAPATALGRGFFLPAAEAWEGGLTSIR